MVLSVTATGVDASGIAAGGVGVGVLGADAGLRVVLVKLNCCRSADGWS